MARNNRTHASPEHNSRYELYSTVCGCFLCHLFRWRYNFILSLHIHAILHLIIIFFNMSLEHVASQSLSFFHAHVSSIFISRARYSTNGRVNKWGKCGISEQRVCMWNCHHPRSLQRLWISRARKCSSHPCVHAESFPFSVRFRRIVNNPFFHIHFPANCVAERISMKNENEQDIAHFQCCSVI